ncbi:MAG: hypothetical protein EPGJADBJ_02707 [Saprospiraceae bacterium]|nr:hypothetical protein [Saprospiraceae bacterium]
MVTVAVPLPNVPAMILSAPRAPVQGMFVLFALLNDTPLFTVIFSEYVPTATVIV